MDALVYEPTLWVAVIGLAGVVTSSVGTLLVKAWLERRSGRREHREVLKGLQQMHLIYRLMQEMVTDCGAERVLLLAGHNSGGVPRAHSPYWTTALHWALRRPSTAGMIKDYQNIAVDAEYIAMLLRCEAAGEIELETQNMPTCQLKDYYMAEGVTRSIVVFLGIKECKLLYLSAARYDDAPYTLAQRAALRLKAARIRATVMEET